LAHHADDDGFHEIQLNGKQLVFLFMAATVASVVIFLCGVLVGRGVRAERGATVADTMATSTGTPDTAPSPQQPATAQPPTPAGSDPTAAAPPPAVDDLSYFNRLEKQKQPKEVLKAAPDHAARQDKPASAPQNTAPPAARTPPPPVPNEPPAKASSPAADLSGDYAVQVAALNARGEADAIARRLASKGYASYVVPPGNGAVMYRVRVGHFKTRRDAEPVFEKLKEEQFKPWITR
jgi:septal ring-binding cell division protein DamX